MTLKARNLDHFPAAESQPTNVYDAVAEGEGDDEDSFDISIDFDV